MRHKNLSLLDVFKNGNGQYLLAYLGLGLGLGLDCYTISIYFLSLKMVYNFSISNTNISKLWLKKNEALETTV